MDAEQEKEGVIQDTPAGRLKRALPVLFGLAAEAKEKVPDGEVFGGVIAVRPAGNGQLTGRFELMAFLADIAALVGYKRDPEEEALELGAQKILGMLPGR